MGEPGEGDIANLKVRAEARAELLELMEQLSEECWAAGWLIHLEHVLWDLTCGKRPAFPRLPDPGDARIARLRQLSAAAEGWWAWPPGEDDPVFVPTARWQRAHDAHNAESRGSGPAFPV